jgi:hypothetical protein
MTMRDISRRLDRLDAGQPSNHAPRRVVQIAQKVGETQAEAIARWNTENPGEPPLQDDDDTLIIILRAIAAPRFEA